MYLLPTQKLNLAIFSKTMNVIIKIPEKGLLRLLREEALCKNSVPESINI